MIQPRSSDAMPDAHLRNLRNLNSRKSNNLDGSYDQSSRAGEHTPSRRPGAGLGVPVATEGSSILQSEARKNLSTRPHGEGLGGDDDDPVVDDTGTEENALN